MGQKKLGIEEPLNSNYFCEDKYINIHTRIGRFNDRNRLLMAAIEIR